MWVLCPSLISDYRSNTVITLGVNIDFFGPASMVFDFGLPIAKEDDTYLFNFSFGESFSKRDGRWTGRGAGDAGEVGE